MSDKPNGAMPRLKQLAANPLGGQEDYRMRDEPGCSLAFEFTTNTERFVVSIITPENMDDDDCNEWLMDSWPDGPEMVYLLDDPDAAEPTCLTCAAVVDAERAPPRFISVHQTDTDNWWGYCQCAACAADIRKEELLLYVKEAVARLDAGWPEDDPHDDPFD